MPIWKQEVYGTGRCVNCGYLGKRDGDLRISECYGVSEYDREFGTLDEYIDPRPKTTIEIVPKIKTFPWCFVGKANLRRETEELFDEKDSEFSHDNVCIHKVLTVKRDCPSWYPWREFASPKEHFEESIMFAMEQGRKEFEQQMEQERKNFELKLEELNKEERRRTNRVMIWLAIAAIIFAFAEVIAALLGITNDSWVLRFFR